MKTEIGRSEVSYPEALAIAYNEFTPRVHMDIWQKDRGEDGNW